nr:hypothetical protein [Desulfobulbaceae bacterium]
MKNVFWIVLIFSTLLNGCGSKSNMEYFLRDDVDIGYVSRIAVVPFENNSRDQYVAPRVRDLVITQILSYKIFDVVDKGLVDSALREEAVDLSKAPMDAALIKRVGQRMNVQAFLMGTIDLSEKVQRGTVSYPQLSITLRLVDIHTGMIFWQVSGNRTGDSLGKRLFGLAHDDEFKVSLGLIRQLLNTLPDPERAAFEIEGDSDGKENSNEILIDGDDNLLIVPQDNDQG